MPEESEEKVSVEGGAPGGISTPSTTVSPVTPRHEATPPPGFGGARVQ